MKYYKLHLIRHGMTAANTEGRYVGLTDVPLSADGIKELYDKADKLYYPRVQKVYTSPLKRCTQTADILYHGAYTAELGLLAEMDFGDFENKTADELSGDPAYTEWLKGGPDARPTGGESLGEMTARTYTALHSVITDMMNSGLTHCAMITHGGIISNMMSCFGLPKYAPGVLNADFGEGFDIIVTAQMWLTSQAFEILGYCPYDKIAEE